MTTHYISLQVIPDLETGASQVLSALYNRLHLKLVGNRLSTVGVSFPEYNSHGLGRILRLHGPRDVLHQFKETDWLKGARDHVRMTEVLETPLAVEHRTVYRRQFKTNVERLRRRRMQRKGETLEQVSTAIPDTASSRPSLPYVQLLSRSTKQRFSLFIGMGEIQPAPVEGSFSSYGLSTKTTIPWF